MNVRVAALVLVLVAVAERTHAQSPEVISADRPGLADSAALAGKGVWQIEAGVQWELHEGEDDLFVPALFRLGVSRRVEARVEGNTLSSRLVGASRQTGLAPTSLGAKVGIVLADDDTPGVAVIGRVFPAWGTDEFHSDHVTGDVRLVIDWALNDRWSLNPNAGFSWSDDGESAFATGLFAMTIGYSPRPALNFFIDTSYQRREASGGTASTVWDGGVAYIPRQNWQFDISAGARTRGETAARAFVAIGFAYRHK
jgi:Putative MetA-pathway of phenol degradation